MQEVVSNRYRLVRPLGRGAFGEVWLCEDLREGVERALKRIPPDAPGDQSRLALESLRREARILSRLRHPNVVRLLDRGEGGSEFIVLELLLGISLQDEIHQARAGGGLRPLAMRIQVLLQAAQALQYVHSEKVLHLNVKPGNFITAEEDRLVLIDFGTARFLEDVQHLPAEATRGTSTHLAPEQIDPGRLLGAPIDQRSDVFAFGLVLYEYIAGEHPFGTDDQGQLARIVTQPLRPLADLVTECPAGLDRLVIDCLRREPRSRLNAMEEVVEELQAVLRDLQGIGRLPRAGTDPLEARRAARCLQQREHCQELMQRARSLWKEGSHQQAIHAVITASNDAPDDEWKTAAETLRTELEKEAQKHGRIETYVQMGRSELKANKTAAAARYLDLARSVGVDHPLVVQFERELSDAKTELIIDAVISEARNLLNTGYSREALLSINGSIKSYPGSPRLLEARKEVERPVALQRAAEDAIRRGEWDRARALLQEGRTAYPCDRSWRNCEESLRKAIAEFDETAKLVMQTDIVLDIQANRFAEAQNRLEEASQKYPEDPRWEHWRTQLVETRESQTRKTDAAEHIRQSFREQQWGKALELLRAATEEFPGDPLWTALRHQLVAFLSSANSAGASPTAEADTE